MFFPLSAPPGSAGRELYALRLSLNAPVVAIEELPVGPASAAIQLRLDAGGTPRIAVAVRSLRSKELAFFAPDEDMEDLPSARVALDAALSFAESMGFLFDDDLVEVAGDAGPAEAEGVWREFCGLEPLASPEADPPGPAPGTEGPASAALFEPPEAPAGDRELLLEELAAAGRLPDAPAAGPTEAPLALSKFRHVLPGDRLQPPGLA